MKKTFSLLVCMIVCLAASQALAAYDFSGKSNATMLNDMKAWTTEQWNANIRALLDTGDVSLIKRSLAVAEKAISSSNVPGVNANLLAQILGDNSPLAGDKLASGGSLRETIAGDDGAINLRTTDASKTVEDYVGRNPGQAEKYDVEEPYTPIKPISPNSSKN